MLLFIIVYWVFATWVLSYFGLSVLIWIACQKRRIDGRIDGLFSAVDDPCGNRYLSTIWKWKGVLKDG